MEGVNITQSQYVCLHSTNTIQLHRKAACMAKDHLKSTIIDRPAKPVYYQ